MTTMATQFRTDEQLDFACLPHFNYQEDEGTSTGYHSVVRLSLTGFLYATDLATLMYGIHRPDARAEARKVFFTWFFLVLTLASWLTS